VIHPTQPQQPCNLAVEFPGRMCLLCWGEE
jgi:hypothetical protein